MTARKKRGGRTRDDDQPTHLECTVRAGAMNGEDRDPETGKRKVYSRGEDVTLSYALARRMETTGRVVIDEDDRAELRELFGPKDEKAEKAAAAKAEKAAKAKGK